MKIPKVDQFLALPKEEQISVIEYIVEYYNLCNSGYVSYLGRQEMQNAVLSLSRKCSTARYLLVTLFCESGVTSTIALQVAELLAILLKPAQLEPIYSLIAECDARSIQAISIAINKSKKYHNKTN